VTAVMCQVTGVTCSFVYGMGLQFAIFPRATSESAHNNGYEPFPLKRLARRPWFIESCLILYQPSVLVHNT